MSNPVQNIENIAPMQEENKSTKPADPIEADYEEGKRLLESGNTAQAAVALHNALLGYEEKNDTNGIANASNQLGHACLARKEYDKALKLYERTWDICKDLGDYSSLLALNNQFVLVYTGLGQYTKAIEVCLDIVGMYRDNNNPRGTVATLEQIAGIYEKIDEKAKAADTYRTISSIHANYKHDKIAQSFVEKAEKLEQAV